MVELIMLHGLPGSGKSTLARTIAKMLPYAVVVQSGAFRKGVMAQWGFDESVPKVRAEKDASYRAMIEKARLLLAEGRTVILDATFHKRYRREWVFALAREVGVGFRVISVSCSEEETKRRLGLRKGSDARDDVLKSVESWNVMRVQSDELCEQVNCFYYDSEKSTGDAAVNWVLGRES